MKIIVEKVEINPGKISIYLYIPNPDERFVSDKLAKRITSLFPDLVNHSCINSKGPKFGDVINNTNIAHLIEHLIIQFQTMSPESNENDTFVGATNWINKEKGTALIEVSFKKDSVVMQALNDAIRQVSITGV